MFQSIKNRALRIALKAMFAILAIVILLPTMLYIPFVQTWVKDVACKELSESTGWNVKIGSLSLKFPIDINIEDVLVLYENSDTMLSAERLVLDVEMLPLMALDVVVNDAQLIGAQYNMVSEDSSMILAAKLHNVSFDVADIAISQSDAKLGNVDLSGGDIRLMYCPEKVDDTQEESAPVEWKVGADNIAINDVRFAMQMLPTIDSLDVKIGLAKLEKCKVDMSTCKVDASYFGLDSLDVKYIYQNVAVAAEEPNETPVEDKSQTWTIEGGKLKVQNSSVVYALKEAKPADGLDMNYLSLSDINFEIDSLYNRGTDITVPLKHISAKERCGLFVTDGKGTFKIDSEEMDIDKFALKTVLSTISVDGNLDMSVFETPSEGNINLDANAQIDIVDVEVMYPIFKGYFGAVPRKRPIELVAKVAGTAAKLDVKEVSVNLPKYAFAEITGEITNVMESEKLGGELAMVGRFDNINFVKPTILDAKLSKQVHFPAIDLIGHASMRGNKMSGDVDLTLETGQAVGSAEFNTANDAYEVSLDLADMPIHAVLPFSDFGDLTASITAKGKGFDLMDKSTELEANLIVDHLGYDGVDYKDVKCDVSLSSGTFVANFDSNNPNLDFTLGCGGELAENHYVVALDCDVRDLDLYALKLMDVRTNGRGRINAFGDIDLSNNHYDLTAEIQSLKLAYDTIDLNTSSVSMQFLSGDSTISAQLDNEDLSVDFTSQVGIDQFVESAIGCYDVAMKQVERISLNIDTLQEALPPFACEIEMGRKGLVPQYLKYSGIEMRDMNLQLYNDSTVYGRGVIHRLNAFGTELDTITAKLVQTGKYLDYRFHVGNRPGTLDNFASVTLMGGVLGSRLSTIYDVKDIRQSTGYHFGTHADLNDSIVKVNIFTPKPRIGYHDWSVNEGNYVQYNYKNQHLDADLTLDGGSSGVIRLFTDLAQSELHDHEQEQVNLQMKGIKIDEWISMLPFMPDMSGELSTDMKIAYKGNQFWGEGDVELKDYKYEGERVGDFNLNALMTLDPKTGNTNLESYMNVNGARVMFAAGVLNDSTATSPMSLKLDIDKFPISTVTAFIPNGIAELQGYLNGEMSMSGSFDKPILTGVVKAEDGAIYVPMFGSKILFPSTDIPVDSGIVMLNKYALLSCNDKPLVIDGHIDIRDMSNAYVDMSIKGRNVQFVDSKQIKKSQLFGRGFANVDATAKGRLSALYVNANVALLSGSNLTYVLQDDVSEIVTETNPDMVHFVQFDDSTSVYGDSLLQNQSFGMSINASLTLQQGNTINAYLSTDGKNRVQVQSNGTLNYAQGFSGDPRVTGQLNVDNGYVKYTPPLIKEVDFKIKEGSYLSFTGNMMNPTLNFLAEEKYKASVSGDGMTSHLVDFIIACKVGGTLSQMDVSFDLNTNDDLTVQNELQSMSQQQRSAQAMNLMLYGSYTGTNTSTMTNNALYSFLNSQLNSWAASAIKGVDLSFGINQYDKAGDGVSTVTSYSYNLSKSLFNDRFKIVVGGNYNTDASAEDNLSENLISDVSIEYLLNSSGSMYARLFRHTGFESILEGQVVETGVGFVLKRKLSNLKHIFKFRPSIRGGARNMPTNKMQLTLPSDSVSQPKDSVKTNVSERDGQEK